MTQGIIQANSPCYKNFFRLTSPRQSTSLAGAIIFRNSSSFLLTSFGRGSCRRIPLYFGSLFNLVNVLHIFYQAYFGSSFQVSIWNSLVLMLALLAQSRFFLMQDKEAGWSPTKTMASRGHSIPDGNSPIYFWSVCTRAEISLSTS